MLNTPLRDRIRAHYIIHSRNRVRLYAAMYLIAAVIVGFRSMAGIPRLFGTPVFAWFLFVSAILMYRWGHYVTWTSDKRYHKKVNRSFLLALKTDPLISDTFKARLFASASWNWRQLDNASKEFENRSVPEETAGR